MPATPALLATWRFKGRDYVPLQAQYGFEQFVDTRGRPSTRVRPQLVRLVLDAADEDARLIACMFDPYQRATSTLVQRHPQGHRLHQLHIQATYCVGYRGYFAPGDAATRWPNEVLVLYLSAAALTLDGVTAECHSVLPWHAPEKVRRHARMLGDEVTQLPIAAALPAPKRVPTVEAPTLTAPPALRSNSETGVYGEHISDAYMRAQGHEKLNDGEVLTPLPPARRPSSCSKIPESYTFSRRPFYRGLRTWSIFPSHPLPLSYADFFPPFWLAPARSPSF
ncbi:type VI secretion system tube protein TssD [Hymenobacter psoromatis]|uniref:type VI secretion system tube protein TssD n=1 Tax=Hymenobacter psoromatis TaxID=1484116 RepID=UPI001CBB0534|nr:type VI secretion system tube protein TssD [Hymenobacter psoromatis]